MAHLNQNRIVRGEKEIPLPDLVAFPDDVVLKERGKTIRDYMDPLILKYWDTYVLDNVDSYINFRAGKKILQRKIEELEEDFWKEYNSKKEEAATPSTP